MKKTVAILIGGKTVEHEVSVITGLQVLDNIDKEKYEPIIVYIKKDGGWYLGKCLYDINNYKNKHFEDIYEVIPTAADNKLVLYPHPHNSGRKLFKRAVEPTIIDLVFPALHGTNAEDGCIHGFFQMNDIPCAFGSVLSSAIGMDKVIMKNIFEAYDLPVLSFTWFYKNDFLNDMESIILNCENIGYPLIIKPANLGSSVGISKADNQEELIDSIQIAASYDKKIIVEKCLDDVREINCAVLGYENNLETSLCEEPIGWKDFLTYEDKYINGGKYDTNEKHKIPADIDEEAANKIYELSRLAFKAVDCAGNARIDFLYDGNNIYINEINTIPGSIAFYLWEKAGISFTELISRILDIAEINQKQKQSNIISYNIDLLNNISSYGKHK